jgi:hypothetical protein
VDMQQFERQLILNGVVYGCDPEKNRTLWGLKLKTETEGGAG